MTFQEGARFAAYLRDSGGQEQDASVTQQEAELKAWARDNGYILTRIFADRARPGSSTAGRDGFEEMIQYFRQGGAGEIGLVVWKYNRFAREIDDAQYFKADLRRRGFEIISVQDNVPAGPEGRLLESIIDWMSQRQLTDMSSDIKRGMRHLILNLKAWPGGRAPVGYKLETFVSGQRRDGSPRTNSRLVPDPETAPLVRKVFEMRAEGCTFPEILRQVPIVSAPASLGRLLSNAIYQGVLRYGQMEIQGFCEPLIDQPTWNAAQNVNRARRERYGYDHPRAVRSRFILTGLLRCARCGDPMHGRVAKNSTGSSYSYYRCQSQNTNPPGCGALLIPKLELEARVVDVMLSEVLTKGTLKALMEEVERQVKENQSSSQSDVERLRHKTGDIRERIARLVLAIEEYGHSPALLKQLGELEEEEREVLEALAQAEAEQVDAELRLDVDLEELAEAARLALEMADHAERARVLRSFVREVRAEKDGELTGEMVVYLFGKGEKVLDIH